MVAATGVNRAGKTSDYRFDTEAVDAVKLLSMRPSQALGQHRDAVYLAATRYRVANPRVLGSALHGDDHDDSDLDLFAGLS